MLILCTIRFVLPLLLLYHSILDPSDIYDPTVKCIVQCPSIFGQGVKKVSITVPYCYTTMSL
jgi:hypothetical protein